jgi:hypothetical protein
MEITAETGPASLLPGIKPKRNASHLLRPTCRSQMIGEPPHSNLTIGHIGGIMEACPKLFARKHERSQRWGWPRFVCQACGKRGADVLQLE